MSTSSIPLRVTLHTIYRWGRYPGEYCSQCNKRAGYGALAEVYLPPLPPHPPYKSEAEEFQAADDACNALADRQEQGDFTMYAMLMFCGECAEKAVVEDIGEFAREFVSFLRLAEFEYLWLASHLQYEPGAYGKYQPFFIHGMQPATIQLIYSRACKSALKGISDEPRLELDVFQEHEECEEDKS